MSAKKTKLKGRPTHEKLEVYRKVAIRMMQRGVPYDDIADCLDISVPTFKKHYQEEILEARTNVVENCYSALLRLVSKDDFQAIRYYLDRVQGKYVKEQNKIEDHRHANRLKEQDKANKGLKEALQIKEIVVNGEQRNIVDELREAGALDAFKSATH